MKTNYYQKFNTRKGNSYIYDGVSSSVIPDEGVLEEIIKLHNDNYDYIQILDKLSRKYDEQILKSAIKFADRWNKKYGGFFVDTDNVIKPIKANADMVKQYMDNGELYLLVLSVTEDCNFRCKYCYLSETYDYTRNRTSCHMTFETAKKAVDFYFDLIRKYKKIKPNKKASINFFGGEPLLEMDLVRKVVEYAKKTCPVELDFDITTNGYLLTDEVADFLVENDFYVAVSLDGDRKNNSNRVMSKNTETFEKVLENIKRFRKRYPLYGKFGLLAVYDINTDLEKNAEFFDDIELPPVLRVTGVASNNTCYYQKFSEEDYARFNKQITKLREEYIEKKKKSLPISTYQMVLFENELFQLYMRRRYKDNKGAILPYTGTCLPGVRLGVRADGTFDICERMNQEFPIGNVNDGYNLENIAQIINRYNDDVTGKCGTCIGNKVCSICYANVAGDKKFNCDSKVCNQVREFVKNGFALLYEILEENPDAFKQEEYDKVIKNMLIFEG
ncbi:MAG: radical SAM protein [Ruminococcus sp.]|nr:radical SAM protein [Ruminococcus sp.]